MKVAIIYDRVNKWGGAERVLLALHKLFPDAPLYTSLYSKKDASWAEEFKVHASFLQKVPGVKRLHEVFAPFMPLAFESFHLGEYDIVISVTSEAAKAVITSSKTLHICLCLTPTRYLWSGYHEYFKSRRFQLIASPIISYLRCWDRIASQRPDAYVAISANVRKRIKKYYHRNSEVIYPPLGLERVAPVSKTHNTNSKYFLVVSRLSRLASYKRVDIAIQAANALRIPLKIIGTGRDVNYYKKMAGKTVEFIGSVPDEKLSEYYAFCEALIFPADEDFGLVMVEAQLHGKPIIAYKSGGATEIVQAGVTGEFFTKQTPESLIQILAKFDSSRYNSEKCMENAQRFSSKVFEKKFMEFVHQKVEEFFKSG